MGVREAVLAVAEGEINGRILASPDIPHKKLANARKGFITRADEVFLLVDDTVFGSGKDGLAITENYIYAKQLFEIPKSIKISSIRSLEYESKRVNLDIYINNNLFLTLSSLERQDHDYLMAILQAAKEAATEGSLEPNQNEESPDIVEKDEVPTLSCDECNVDLPPNAKFCLECGAKVLPKGVCLACDVNLPENAKFCPECGTPAGQQVEAKTSPAAVPGPQIDADQARNEISELLADAEQDVSIDSDGDLRIYFTTKGVPSFTSKLRGSAMSYSIKVMSEGEVAEDDSLSVNYSSDDDSISFGGPYLRVGKLPSAQYEAQIDASFWATTAVEIHEIKLKAGKIDAPTLGSSDISLSGLKATKDEGDGSYGVEYELKAYPNHYVHFDILSEKPEDDVNLWPMLESDSTRSGTAWLYDIKPGDTFYLVFAEYEKIVDGITATLSGTAEPMEGAYDEADDARAQSSGGSGGTVRIKATYCVDWGQYEFPSESERDAFIANPQFLFDFNIDNVDDKEGVERIFGSSSVSPEFSENPPHFTVTNIQACEGDPVVAEVSAELEMFFDIQVSLDEFLEWVEDEGETWRYTGRIMCVGEEGLQDSVREEYESFEVVAGCDGSSNIDDEGSSGNTFKINAGWEKRTDGGAICRWIIVWQQIDESQIAGAIGGYSGGGTFQVEQFFAQIEDGNLSSLMIDIEDKITGKEIDFWEDVPSKMRAISDDAQDVIFDWNDREEWEDAEQLVLVADKADALREDGDMLLLDKDYTPFAHDILSSVGITAVPVETAATSAVVNQADAANPLSEVREDIQAIEDKLYERGMLVSATGDHDAQVSISFEEWGEDGDRGLYWVISITSENSNDGDEDEGERISDYVSEKIDEISENWPSSSKALIEDSSGAVVLLNGSILY